MPQLDSPDEIPRHISYFNLTVGLIFNELYLNFPIYQELTYGRLGEPFASLLETPDVDGITSGERKQVAGRTYIKDSDIPPESYVVQTVRWLEQEQFIRSDGDTARPFYQLTSKSLTILNRTPEGIDKRLGSALGSAVKAAGSEAGKSAIGEVVGQIIGAAARGMLGA
jgi:hypothetical protein